MIPNLSSRNRNGRAATTSASSPSSAGASSPPQPTSLQQQNTTLQRTTAADAAFAAAAVAGVPVLSARNRPAGGASRGVLSAAVPPSVPSPQPTTGRAQPASAPQAALHQRQMQREGDAAAIAAIPILSARKPTSAVPSSTPAPAVAVGATTTSATGPVKALGNQRPPSGMGSALATPSVSTPVVSAAENDRTLHLPLHDRVATDPATHLIVLDAFAALSVELATLGRRPAKVQRQQQRAAPVISHSADGVAAGTVPNDPSIPAEAETTFAQPPRRASLRELRRGLLAAQRKAAGFLDLVTESPLIVDPASATGPAEAAVPRRSPAADGNTDVRKRKAALKDSAEASNEAPPRSTEARVPVGDASDSGVGAAAGTRHYRDAVDRRELCRRFAQSLGARVVASAMSGARAVDNTAPTATAAPQGAATTARSAPGSLHALSASLAETVKLKRRAAAQRAKRQAAEIDRTHLALRFCLRCGAPRVLGAAASFVDDAHDGAATATEKPKSSSTRLVGCFSPFCTRVAQRMRMLRSYAARCRRVETQLSGAGCAQPDVANVTSPTQRQHEHDEAVAGRVVPHFPAMWVDAHAAPADGAQVALPSPPQPKLLRVCSARPVRPQRGGRR